MGLGGWSGRQGTWRDEEDRAAAYLKTRNDSPKLELARWDKIGPAVLPFVPPVQSRTCALGDFVMAHPTEEQIRKRAFELWEQSGKPEGRQDEFWDQAQKELQGAEERGAPNKGADI
jgi:hypothetical protein